MLRVKEGNTIGSAYANEEELNHESLTETPMNTTRYYEPDEHRNLTNSEIRNKNSELWDDGRFGSDSNKRREQISSIVSEQLSEERIQSLQVTFREKSKRTELFRDASPVMWQVSTNYSIGAWAVCEQDGDVRSGYDRRSSWSYANLSPSDVLERAVERGIRQLGSEPAESYRGPVLINSYASSSLMRMIRQLLDGESMIKGRSAWSQELLGERVADESVTVVDDPARNVGPGNMDFDAEGYPTESVKLIDSGVLKRFLTNQYVASRAGIDNIRRAQRSFKSRPAVGHSNLGVQTGDREFETLRSDLNEGPVITDVQTGSGLDAVAGHLSVGVKGYWIENGTFSHPFHEGTLSCSMETLIKNISGLGDKAPMGQRLSSPAMLVDDLTIGGPS